MKTLIFLVLLAVQSSAYAQTPTYTCDGLKNQSGEVLVGAPKYSFEVDGQNVTIHATPLIGPVQTYTSSLSDLAAYGAVYQAKSLGDFAVFIPNQQSPLPLPRIDDVVDGEIFSATCQLE